MEILSCHSNLSAYATAKEKKNKKTNKQKTQQYFVEANTMNISAKF